MKIRLYRPVAGGWRATRDDRIGVPSGVADGWSKEEVIGKLVLADPPAFGVEIKEESDASHRPGP